MPIGFGGNFCNICHTRQNVFFGGISKFIFDQNFCGKYVKKSRPWTPYSSGKAEQNIFGSLKFE